MMSSAGLKKDETRFTIRFNPADPRHRKAMGALKASGRRKATLIADAVCEYLERHDGHDSVSQLQANHMPLVESVIVPQQKEPAESHHSDDDLRNAVLGGLSMGSVDVLSML